MNYGIRFAIAGIASALVLIYGCQDQDLDGSPSAGMGPSSTTVFVDDFSDGVRTDRWRVDDMREAQVDRTSTNPSLTVGKTAATSTSTFVPRDRTQVRFDVAFPATPAADALFRFSIDGTAIADTFFEIGLDHTGRVLILGFEVPIVLSDPGNHEIVFVVDQYGTAYWFIDGAAVLTRGGFPVQPFGLGLLGSGAGGFVVDNVSVTTGP